MWINSIRDKMILEFFNYLEQLLSEMINSKRTPKSYGNFVDTIEFMGIKYVNVKSLKISFKI